MKHIVLARKYRPKKFDDVVGQDLIVSTLKAAIEKGRIAHAMLFTGSRGIGKTTIARLVAKALVCRDNKGANPCGLCEECLAIDNFASLDVMEIDGASNTGVDDVRELRDSARYQPASAKYKIFIIDEVHMLSISAFNALLKILEEPPAHVIFIFATTEAHKIPKTILSRCQRYDFKRVSADTIFKTLKSILLAEGHAIDDGGLRLISEQADGGLRDALSMAEQIISGGKEFYDADFVAKVLGVVNHSAVKDICQAIIEGNIEASLVVLKDIYEKGLDLCQLMDSISERFRILSLCAHVDKEPAKKIIPALEDDDFIFASKYDKADLKRLFAMSLDAMGQVFNAQRPLLAMELFILRGALRPSMRDAMSINYCLQKLDSIMHNRPLPPEPQWIKGTGNANVLAVSPSVLPEENALVGRNVEGSLKTPVQHHVLTQKNAAERKDPELSPNFLRPGSTTELMPNVGLISVPMKENTLLAFKEAVDQIAKLRPSLAVHLRHARPIFFSDQRELKLCFERGLHYEEVLRQRDDKELMGSLEKFFERKVSLVINLQKGNFSHLGMTIAELEENQKKKEQEKLVKRALENPLVKKALDLFGGDVTNVSRLR